VALFGPYLVGCALLLIAGWLKLSKPGAAARTLTELVPPLSERHALGAARVISVAEVLIGAAGILLPRWPIAIVVCAAYASFALVLLYVLTYMRAKGSHLASCGCLSALDAPPSRLHLSVDLALAASAATVAATGRQAWLPTLLAHSPLFGIPLLAASAVSLWLVMLVLVSVPAHARSRRLLEQTNSRS
jgi:hypothetical protein